MANITFDIDSLVVHRYDFIDNSKPQTRALNLFARSVYTVEPLKYFCKSLLGRGPGRSGTGPENKRAALT